MVHTDHSSKILPQYGIEIAHKFLYKQKIKKVKQKWLSLQTNHNKMIPLFPAFDNFLNPKHKNDPDKNLDHVWGETNLYDVAFI